jgi:hypothetical protein
MELTVDFRGLVFFVSFSFYFFTFVHIPVDVSDLGQDAAIP